MQKVYHSLRSDGDDQNMKESSIGRRSLCQRVIPNFSEAKLYQHFAKKSLDCFGIGHKSLCVRVMGLTPFKSYIRHKPDQVPLYIKNTIFQCQ